MEMVRMSKSTFIHNQIEVNIQKNGIAENNPIGNQPRYKYRVEIKNRNTGRSKNFPFYGPAISTNPDKPEPYEVIQCITEDALVPERYEDVLDMFNALCYEDTGKARKVWKQCQNTNNKLKSLKNNSEGLEEEFIRKLNKEAREREQNKIA